MDQANTPETTPSVNPPAAPLADAATPSPVAPAPVTPTPPIGTPPPVEKKSLPLMLIVLVVILLLVLGGAAYYFMTTKQTTPAQVIAQPTIAPTSTPSADETEIENIDTGEKDTSDAASIETDIKSLDTTTTPSPTTTK